MNKTEVATTLALSDRISEGTEIAGRYRILSLIGQGGMGTVYRAEHLHLRKVFALKVLQTRYTDRPGVAARFEREAIAAGRIEHPNVVPATDFGRLPDGAFFLVLEFVDGRSLRSELKGGAMPVPRALGIMRGVVAGVRAAHAKGIIHRDLKPENIMLIERDGNPDFVRLLDFGVARMDSETRNDGPKLTELGAMLGTPPYMSPEQILGHAVDARSDLYALGVILFELLTGECPFLGNFARLLEQHVTTAPPELPPALSSKEPRLAEIVRVLLSKAPDNRFQTASELAAALEERSVHPLDRTRAAPPPRSPRALAQSVSRSLRGLGGRVPPFMGRLASSTSGIASRSLSNVRDTVRNAMRRRSDRTLVLNRRRRVARTIVAARQLGRQTVISGSLLAGSAKAAWSRTIDYCRAQSRQRPRLALGLCCLAAFILTGLLVVAIRSGQNANSNAVAGRPAGAKAAARVTSAPASSNRTSAPAASGNQRSKAPN